MYSELQLEMPHSRRPFHHDSDDEGAFMVSRVSREREREREKERERGREREILERPLSFASSGRECSYEVRVTQEDRRTAASLSRGPRL